MKKSFASFSFIFAFSLIFTGCFDYFGDDMTDYKRRKEGTEYTVRHFQENLDGGYSVYDEETLYGTSSDLTEAVAAEYEGFLSKEFEQKEIKIDGSTVIEIYYDRKTISLTFDAGDGEWFNGDKKRIVQGKYGAPININSFVRPERLNFAFFGWLQEIPENFPSSDLLFDADWCDLTDLDFSISEVVAEIVTGRTKNLSIIASRRSDGKQLLADFLDQVKWKIKQGTSSFIIDDNEEPVAEEWFIGSSVKLKAQEGVSESGWDAALYETQIFANVFGNPTPSTWVYVIPPVLNSEIFRAIHNEEKGSSQNFATMTEYVVPEGIISIDASLFGGCTKLETIILPDTIQSIGNTAFAGCSALKSIVIPDSVESIGNAVFGGCAALESVVLSDNIAEIPDSLFSGCSKLESVHLPSNLEALGVSVFGGCSSLKEIELPDGLESIGNGAFSGSGLESIEIPSSVKSLGNTVFGGCSSLTSVEMSDGLETIGNSAFGGCISLLSVEIPNSVTSIGSQIFQGCTAVENIVLPDSLTELEINLLQTCTNLKTVHLPEELEEILPPLLNYCRNLESIVIPPKVPTIYAGTFSGMTKLTSVEFENPDGAAIKKEIASNAFGGCTALESIILPEGLEVLNEHVFGGCTALVSCELPSTLTDIIPYAFGSCTKLEALDIPAGVTELKDSVFASLKGLKSLTFEEGSQLKKIGKNACVGCTSLENIEIPEGAEEIGENAFSNCDSLKSARLPDSIETLGAGIFTNCKALETVTLPSELEVLPNSTFMYCESLKEIDLPETLETIGASAFQYCKNMKGIDLPETLTEIGNSAFYECRSIENVEVPAGVTTLNGSIFYNCTSLKSLVIDGPINSMPDLNYPVSGYTALEYLEFKNFFCGNICMSLPALKTVVVGEGALFLPEYFLSYSNEIETVVLPSSLREIYSGAFNSCNSIKEFHFPKNEDYPLILQGGILYGCQNLEKVVFEGDIVGKTSSSLSGFFNSCPKLKEVEFNGEVGNSFDSGFGASSLEKITFAEGLTSLPDRMLYRVQVKQVIIPSTVTSIGKEAFDMPGITDPILESVVFEDPTGWYAATEKDAASGTEISSDDLRDSEIAASLLKTNPTRNTGATGYADCYWYKR